MANTITLPKDAILNLNGYAVKLADDTVVISSDVTEDNLNEVINSVSDMPSRNITQQTIVE